jgi:hypothetical protein
MVVNATGTLGMITVVIIASVTMGGVTGVSATGLVLLLQPVITIDIDNPIKYNHFIIRLK